MARLSATATKGLRERLISVVAAAVLAASISGGLATAADAASCYNCYGIVTWDDGPAAPNYHGAIAYVKASSLHVADHCNALAADLMWIFDASGYYIETGLLNGTHVGAGGGCFGLWWMWGETKPGVPFTAHYSPGVDYNTDFAARVEYIGGNSWRVFKNGSPLDPVATNHPPPITYAQAGIEGSGNTQFNAAGWAHTLQKKNASTGGWSYNWPGSFLGTYGIGGVNWCPYGIDSCVNGWIVG